MAGLAQQIAELFNPSVPVINTPSSGYTLPDSESELNRWLRAKAAQRNAGTLGEMLLPGMVPHTDPSQSIFESLSPQPSFESVLPGLRGELQGSPVNAYDYPAVPLEATAGQSQIQSVDTPWYSAFENFYADGGQGESLRPQLGMEGEGQQIVGPPALQQFAGAPGNLAGSGGNFQGGSQSGGFGGGGGGFANVPQGSDLDILMALAASAVGGGGWEGFTYRAPYVLGAQRAAAIENANTARSLYRSSPRAESQKEQRSVYQQRMNGDINRFIQAKSQDVNGAIPQEEWEGAWNQIRSKYSPLGLDPGPSPFEVSWEAAQDQSPEFRNAKLIGTMKEKYGEDAADVMGSMIQAGAKPADIARYHLELEKTRAEERNAMLMIQAKRAETAKQQIETFRQRDLDLYKQTGITSQQLKKNAGMVQSTPDYLQGESAIHAYYDAQLEALNSGGVSAGRLFANGPPKDITAKSFPEFVRKMQQGQSGMSPAEHGDIITFPATVSENDPAVVAAKRSGQAVDVNDPRVMQAVQRGESVLVKQGGKQFLVRLKPQI